MPNEVNNMRRPILRQTISDKLRSLNFKTNGIIKIEVDKLTYNKLESDSFLYVREKIGLIQSIKYWLFMWNYNINKPYFIITRKGIKFIICQTK